MTISVIIPAFNEEKYLSETLNSIQRAREYLLNKEAVATELIVVDNDSTDSTSHIASSAGASIVKEITRNIAAVRNAGASLAKGDILVFIDADTIVPPELLWRIQQIMGDPSCPGGAVDTDYRADKTLMKIYLQVWRIAGKIAGMAQGATQFCRREVFVSLSGYDESLYMGEDIDFYSRLKKLTKRRNGRVVMIDELRVRPSTRRFDQWRLWRALVWTHPLFILFFQRRREYWDGWYKTVPR